MYNDTIAAIATGITNAGIGIIRVSGPNAISVIDNIYLSIKGKKASELKSHHLYLGNISDGTEVYDEVLLSVMKAPHSYTGEDTVEINCHGGMYVCRKILKLVLKNGARSAEPGEFTKRAFLNGRMDLSRAEAVMDLINAENEFAAKNSISQLKGSIHTRIITLRENILHELAFIEAALDDPEHYDLSQYSAVLSEKIRSYITEIDKILSASETGSLMKNGIRTAILGKPNAGKSSILNMLSGFERAIVTDIAGTTRDVIEESVKVGDFQLNLIDTAGIRDTEDVVEKIGVDKAIEKALEADLILFVADSSVKLDQNDRQIIKLIQNCKTIILYNKTDLESACSIEEIMEVFGKDVPYTEFSTKSGKGLEDFVDKLSECFNLQAFQLNEELVITNIRQQEELNKSRESLNFILDGINENMPEDVLAVDIMDAYKHLGYIIGDEVEDDLVNKIFSEFCMGK